MFPIESNKLKCIAMFVISLQNLKNYSIMSNCSIKLQYLVFLKKHEVFLSFTVSALMNT